MVAAVEVALAGGAPLIQLRTKAGSDRQRWELALAVAERCRAAGALLVINDRADLAAACGAGGVHLGADDLPIDAARVVVGRHALVGATCRDAAQAQRAEAEGADYVGVGPAFATTTKPDLSAPIGPAGLARVTSAVRIPVVAIGGVSAQRVAEVIGAGAQGVAVCDAVFGAADPTAALSALMAAVPSGLDQS